MVSSKAQFGNLNFVFGKVDADADDTFLCAQNKPKVVYTNGVNEPFSTVRTRELYMYFLIFSLSCWL